MFVLVGLGCLDFYISHPFNFVFPPLSHRPLVRGLLPQEHPFRSFPRFETGCEGIRLKAA